MTIHTNIDKNIAQSVDSTPEKMRTNEQGKSMIYRNSKYRKTSKLSLANIAIGKDPYVATTIADMREQMIERVEHTATAIDTFEGWDAPQNVADLKAPMAYRCRNGFKIKIGYGAKNEHFKDDFAIEFFAVNRRSNDIAEAIEYLEAISADLKAGELDDMLEARLNQYKLRAKSALEIRNSHKAKFITIAA